MPPAFCIAQTILIALGAFLLTGVCTSFAVATFLAVYRPYEIRDFSTLRWRPIYWWIVGVFPACASAVQIAVLIKTGATKPAEDMHCDATNPLWLVLLTYRRLWTIFDMISQGHDFSVMLGCHC